MGTCLMDTVSVLQNKKHSGDGQWCWLYNLKCVFYHNQKKKKKKEDIKFCKGLAIKE